MSSTPVQASGNAGPDVPWKAGPAESARTPPALPYASKCCLTTVPSRDTTVVVFDSPFAILSHALPGVGPVAGSGPTTLTCVPGAVVVDSAALIAARAFPAWKADSPRRTM